MGRIDEISSEIDWIWKRAEKIVYKNVVKATKSRNCHDIWFLFYVRIYRRTNRLNRKNNKWYRINNGDWWQWVRLAWYWKAAAWNVPIPPEFWMPWWIMASLLIIVSVFQRFGQWGFFCSRTAGQKYPFLHRAY